MLHYKTESTGNGAFWTITRFADGATLFLQGDDASAFVLKLGNTHDVYPDDDVCAEYDEVFVANDGM